MHLLVGLRSSWKCVEVSLQDGSTPVIGGVPLPDCNIEPAVWFKVLVMDSVCIDCSEHLISWTMANKHVNHLSNSPSSSSISPSSSNFQGHTLMAAHEDGEPSCPDNLHDLFEAAETLFRASPLCSPSHHHHSSSPPNSSSDSHQEEEEWEHQLWLRLLHTLLLPLLTLQREDLASLQLSLEHYCSHTITALDSNVASSTALSHELKDELDLARASLLPQVTSSPTHPHPPHLMACLNSDLQQMEQEARNKVAYCARTLAFQSRMTANGSPALDRGRLEADKKQAEADLLTSVELKSVVEAMAAKSKSLLSSRSDPPPLMSQRTERDSSELQLDSLTKQYLSLHKKLQEARHSAKHWSSKKVLALSVREAMEQTVASLQAGHVTVGMDTGMHGGHSTDVLAEASLYKVRDEFTTLSERVKKLLDMVHGQAARLHKALVRMVETEWFPALCCNDDDGFVVIPADPALTPPSPPPHRTSTFSRSLSWRHHFSFKKPRALSTSAHPIPTSMAQAGKLLHIHFKEIVGALCNQLADSDSSFQQQVWLCYENIFFDTFFSSFLSRYKSENLKLCEQMRANALSASILPPSSLLLHIPDSSWLSLFPPRSFHDASLLYSQSSSTPVTFDPPQLNSDLQTRFGPVVTDLYHMVRARAPLRKLQLLTSAFRKTTAALSSLKLESLADLEEDHDKDAFHLAGVSCDDLLPLLVLLLLQLPPVFLSSLWLHCLLLEDCCPVFLQAGWHGYSLTTFRSSLTIISEL